MSGILGSVRDCSHNHPVLVTIVGLVVFVPGTFFIITGKPPNLTYESIANISGALSEYTSQYPQELDFNFSLTGRTYESGRNTTIRILENTREHLEQHLIPLADQLRLDVLRLLAVWKHRWAAHFPISRLLSAVYTAALPAAFLLLARLYPCSWAAQHQITIASALHILALITLGNQTVSIQDLLITAFFMALFKALEMGTRSRKKESRDGCMDKMVGDSASCDSPQDALYHDSRSVVETLLSQSHSIAKSSIFSIPKLYSSSAKPGHGTDTIMMSGSRDEEMERLRTALTEARTAQTVKELEAKRARAEVHKARVKLDQTYTEYQSLREEMRNIKQNLARDHQAVVYRKDIELFAMRKAGEQKENYIKDRESKLQDIYRSQKAVLELKDAHIRNLKDRVSHYERQNSPEPNTEASNDDAMHSVSESESQSAVQVKLYRVQGRSSVEIAHEVEEKDMEIAKLKLDLSKAASAVEALTKTQEELKRAWDATFEAENGLKEERKRHADTQHKLRDAVKRVEEEIKIGSHKGALSTLPTIDEQDKKELEAMYNLRLYTKIEAFEKRIQNSNSKVFQAEQEVETLKEQLRLEKAINEDMATARPSLVHRVHFQRMEGQLRECRDALEAVGEEIANKDHQIDELSHARVVADQARMKAEQEKDDLRNSITQLESTKQQLMLDHERLAKHRLRQRTTSADYNPSARSSGATLITEPSASSEPAISSHDPSPLSLVSQDAAPSAPTVALTPTTTVESIQATPERHVRQEDRNRLSLISNDVPPAELRSPRRRSLTLKSLIKKMVNKDGIEEGDTTTNRLSKIKEKDKEKRKSFPLTAGRPKTASAPKDKKPLVRPETATATQPESADVTRATHALSLPPPGVRDFATVENSKTEQAPRPKTAAPAASEANGGLTMESPRTSRYHEEFDYSSIENAARPQTATVGTGGKTGKQERPKSRAWSVS
ncbi:unnamed protein product [Periconia digitata]|uniref:Uncharacterized protein n=1 Tax=Periconia digitata TaxID=1303443 RepID=A0A9W4UB54_9PLEO|nr:unnamed protein product [Periconia digitata]